MGEKGQDAAAAVVKEELLAMLKEKLKVRLAICGKIFTS